MIVKFYLLIHISFLLIEYNVSFCQSNGNDTLPRINLHFQHTIISQGHPTFDTLYSGQNSLQGAKEIQTSLTTTIFLGTRIFDGLYLYFNPELSGGGGMSQVQGVAGFPNGETVKVSSNNPIPYIARFFFRFDLGFSRELDTLQDQANQLAALRSKRYLSIIAGKYALSDFFDNNIYSHDPRGQFMNWAIMNAGAWDYPADAKGYTWGVSLELGQPSWSLRLAAVLEPKVANGLELETDINRALGTVAEFEKSYTLRNNDGKIRILIFHNKANMGSYSETLNNPNYRMDITKSRQPGRTKKGFEINIEQKLSGNTGLFSRFSWNDGNNESWAFTEIDRSFLAGISLNGNLWKRKTDEAGAAVVINSLSNYHRQYLEKGGYGFIIGDGRLNYGPEGVLELYYKLPLIEKISFSGDYQFILHPAYNIDRGPVHVFAIRLHAEF